MSTNREELEDMVHIYNGILFSHKKEGNKAISSNMDGPRERHSQKATAPHSSTLAWKIPWTEEPGGLQSMGSSEVNS